MIVTTVIEVVARVFGLVAATLEGGGVVARVYEVVDGVLVVISG